MILYKALPILFLFFFFSQDFIKFGKKSKYINICSLRIKMCCGDFYEHLVD